MKKNLFTVVFLVLGCLSEAAENRILNADFSELSPAGLPLHWSFGGTSGTHLSRADGKAVRISPPISAVQRKIAIQSGKSYQLSYEAKGTPDTVFQLYGSWQQGNEEKRRYTSPTKHSCGAEFKTYKEIFRTEENVRDFQLYLNVLSGGEFQLRNLELTEFFADDKLKNADFSQLKDRAPIHWRQRNDASLYRYSGGIAELEGKGKATLLVQTTDFKPGERYICSYEVRGRGSYRTYFGWIETGTDKKQEWRSAGEGIYKASGEWTKQKFRFQISEGAEKVASNLVLQAEKESVIQWRNVRMEPQKAKKLLGGVWSFTGETDYENDVLTLRGLGQKTHADLENIEVKPGQHYRLGFRIFGVGKAQNSTGFHVYRVVAICGKQVIESPWDDAMDDQYQQKQFCFTVPPDTEKLTLQFLGGYGSIYRIDRITLEACEPEIPKAEQLKILEPFYRHSFYSSRPEEKNVRGVVVFPKGVKSAEVRFNGEVRTLTDGGSFHFDASGLAVGDYPLTVAFDNGESVSIVIRKLAPAPVEVVLAPDLFFYVNGKRFVPNTIPDLRTGRVPNGAYQEARNGINLVFTTGSDAESEIARLNEAEKLGMKVLYRAGCLRSTDPDEQQAYLHNKYNLDPAILRHPAFFGWFMVDEPAWGGISLARLETTYKLLREFDPYHPVWINEAPRGGLETHRQVAGACDIYGVDIYPVPAPSMHSGLEDKMMSSVGKYAELCRAAGDDRKAVWLYLQGFSWKSLADPNSQEGNPTPEELRFMTLDAWIHGATGTLFWGTTKVRSTKFYHSMQSSIKRIHSLSGILVLPRRAIEVSAPLFAAEYTDGEKRYLLVENPSGDTAPMPIPEGFRVLDGPNPSSSLPPWSVTVLGNAPIPAPAYELPPEDPKLEIMPDPFLLTLKETGEQYTGKANWIWAKGMKDSQRFTVAEGHFLIEKKVKSAEVFYTVDDIGEFTLNDVALAPPRGCMVITAAPVTVKNGLNIVRVRARNVVAAAGILFELRVTYEDGSVESFCSGADWKASAEGEDMKPAEVVAPFGSGAWGAKPRIR